MSFTGSRRKPSLKLRSLTTLCCITSIFFTRLAGLADDGSDISFSRALKDVATNVDYSIRIEGEIITPSADGPQKFPLKSAGEFRFQNRSFPSTDAGPSALKAIRRFESASTSTTVGKDHTTKVSLSPSYRTITVSGEASGLVHWSPNFALPRKQLDLLQMPFDVLAVQALLPTNPVKAGDKWNIDSWLAPVLTGIEAVIEQSATCNLVSVDATSALISFTGKIKGAVQGSAAEITYSGEISVNRADNQIESFVATQKEKRSPGPVSPGLDVTVRIAWKQSSTDDGLLEQVKVPAELPSEQQRHLFLQTPLKLRLRHSREWYLFHETPAVLMMRQLRDGNLISQCNISTTITVPPQQFTPDSEFLADVTESVRERKGQILNQATVRDDGRWRIRHVQAAGDATGKGITWNYYLCTAVSGEQFSIVFSHAKDDQKEFGDEAIKLLSTLQIARPRALLPF